MQSHETENAEDEDDNNVPMCMVKTDAKASVEHVYYSIL